MVRAIALQSDGKIIVGGAFTEIAGASRHYLARLNQDGTRDTTWNLFAQTDATVRTLAVQADGKVLVGGDFTQMSLQTRNRIARLEADGALDAAFNPNANGVVWAISLQSNGKILVGGNFTQIAGTGRNYMARLQATGALDTGFLPPNRGQIRVVASQPDGKVLAAGSQGVGRLNADGSADPTLNAATNTWVFAMAVQPDGKILVGGSFTKIADKDFNRIARLGPDGDLDLTFNPGANNAVYSLVVQPDGKILAGGVFSQIGGRTRNNIARLHQTGHVDTSLGDLSGANGAIYALAVQPDGRTVIGGNFTEVSIYTRNRIARISQEGIVDGFNPGANGVVYTLAVQPDGKILVGGNFTEIAGQPRNRIARLNANGTLDTTFNPPGGANATVRAMLLQPDGKIVVGGSFTNIAGAARHYLARLNQDGTRDTTWNLFAQTNAYVDSLAGQADGKILVGGAFTEIFLQPHNRIARLEANGALDATFNSSANNLIMAITQQPNGKIVVGRAFTTIAGASRHHLARLNQDGTRDTTWNIFAQTNNFVRSLTVQSDNRILLGGDFTELSLQTRNRIARLQVDGALDGAFDPNASLPVFATALQSDGKVVLGGIFLEVGGLMRWRLARLGNSTAALQRLEVLRGGGTVRWHLGGSFPWPYQVFFEQSSNGLTWTALGWGQAMADGSGYELSGAKLPVRNIHYVRATGYAQSKGSVSLHRSVLQFYAQPALCPGIFLLLLGD
ncbi:hypothetical protein [Desulfonatronum sp. SC1]|uniref:hypothetical protein n=1 Tax=Desulfonatronum sp. SC1 TaxID=2109626 RepID=UPI001304E879|nr:hypothetical protein [Desulfonatronum sp. SC1]